MTVFEAVESELASMGDVGRGALAASALTLASEMDNPKNGGTSKSMISKELRETLAALRALAPPKETEDELKRLRDQRDARRAGSQAAKDQARP